MEQYLPEYGGFCAYGLAVGKKFYADPTVWKIVDGKLYLNLDSKIQKKFESDLTANIEKADTNWPSFKMKNRRVFKPSEPIGEPAAFKTGFPYRFNP